MIPLSKKSKPDIQRQALCSHEFDIASAFNKTNIAQTKLLFEGEGCLSRENLYGLYKPSYEGACVIIATNKLPGPASYDGDNKFKDNGEWDPICERTNFSFTFDFGSDAKSHALSHTDVSVALLHLIDHPSVFGTIEANLSKAFSSKARLLSVDENCDFARKAYQSLTTVLLEQLGTTYNK